MAAVCRRLLRVACKVPYVMVQLTEYLVDCPSCNTRTVAVPRTQPIDPADISPWEGSMSSSNARYVVNLC
jgi:hypothetical protein